MDYKSAIVIIPSPELWDPIQKFRSVYDPAFERWMPHINIIWPFVPQGKFNEVLPEIQNLMQNIDPFRLSFNSIQFFGKNGTTYLSPQTQNRSIEQIHSQLMNLSVCKSTNIKKEFTPHLTIGKGTKIKQLIQSIKWEPIHFMVRKIYIIARTDSTPFKIFHEINLGVEQFPLTTLTTKSLPVSTQQIEPDQESSLSTSPYTNIGPEQNIVRVSRIGSNWIYKIKSDTQSRTRSVPKKSVQIVLVVDNSGSMGSYTRQSVNVIGRGMFSLDQSQNNPYVMIPGKVILFSDKAVVANHNVTSPDDLSSISYPWQGRTNITDGLECAIKEIVDQLKNKLVPKSTHFIVVFLSDGEHNFGISPQSRLDSMRKNLDLVGALVTFLVVGVTSNSQTDLGMKIKTKLETVSMDQLDNIYYANSTREMAPILQTLQEGAVSSLRGGLVSELELGHGGVFFDSNLRKNRIYLGSNDDQLILVNSPEPIPPSLVIDGVEQSLVIEDFDPNDITRVMDTIVPKLARERIAHGPEQIRFQITSLEKILDEVDIIKKRLKKDIELPTKLGKIPPEHRRMMLKRANATTTELQEERGKLRQLLVTVSNDSSNQASFLQGINKKYAAKAMIRASTQDTTLEQLTHNIKKIRPQLRNALTQDLIHYAQLIASSESYSDFMNKLEPEQQNLMKELVGGVKPDTVTPHDKFDSIYPAMSEYLGLECSMLSLNTPWEEFNSWLETLDSNVEFETIYSMLVSFGLIAYPVVMEHNNAVQMDPFQTQCQRIEPCLIDTSSLLLALQTQIPIASQTRELIKDALVLIDPTCPNSSKVVYWSLINEYFSSITLCRDLYMYSGPQMFVSLHAHSYLKSAELAIGSEAYLGLALKILYSVRRHWNLKCKEGIYVDLLKRWIYDWSGLTQSEEDNCNHPVQVVLAFGALDLAALDLNTDSLTIPFTNLFNEVLSRTIRIYLRGLAGSRNTTSHAEASRILCRLLDITESNSPQPLPDVLASEPERNAVEETCPRGHILNTELFSEFKLEPFNDMIQKTLRPYMIALELSRSVNSFLNHNKISWEDLMVRMERMDKLDDLKSHIRTQLNQVKSINVLEYIGVNSGNWNQVGQTMYVQAMMCHDSQSRKNITNESVTDSETFYQLTTLLHMEFYDRTNKLKRQKYLDCIGDVKFEQALSCDEYQYRNMCALHTHTHSKNIFRALAMAAKRDPYKMKIFLEKSNDSVGSYLSKLHD